MIQRRNDNWANTLSSLGSIRDKSAGAVFRRRRRLTRHEVETLNDQSEICARVVWKIVDDAFRAGWTLPGEHEAFRLRFEREIKGSERLAEAAGWSRLYGACGLVLPVVDGRAPDQPLNMATVRAMSAPNPIPAYQIEPLTYDAAFGSPTYREILTYQIQTLSPSDPLHTVHASRVIALEPIKLPIESRIEHLGAGTSPWGPSVLQRMYDEFLREGSARAHANAMMYTASLLALKMQGVADAGTTDEGRRIVRENLSAMREGMDALGLIGLDAGDDLISIQRGFGGAPEMISTQRDALAAALPMPREIGLNESPSGLRGGELSGAQALWHAAVGAYQRTVLGPALERMLRLTAQAWGYDLGDCEIDWAPLWVPDDREQAEVGALNAGTDRAYYEIGSLGSSEVRRARFVEGRRGSIELDEEQACAVRKSHPYMTPALEIVRAVHAGEVPRDAGAQMLIAGGFDATLLGSAGAEGPPMVELMAREPDD